MQGKPAICHCMPRSLSWAGGIRMHRGLSDAFRHPLPPPIPFHPKEIAMEIADGRVATIHYTLTADAGNVIDNSPADQPLG